MFAINENVSESLGMENCTWVRLRMLSRNAVLSEVGWIIRIIGN